MSKTGETYRVSSRNSTRPRRIMAVAVLSLAISGVLGMAFPGGFSPIAAAHAQDKGHDSGGGHDEGKDDGHEDGGDDGERGGGGGDQDKGKGKRGASARGETDSGSRSVTSSVLSEDVEAAAEEDSDKRGPKYGGGRDATGKPPGAGTMKGDLFGDVVVILRDANGVPVLDEFGHVQPIDAAGNLIPINEDGEIEVGSEALAQAVELGRLNVGRSPDSVTDKSYDEALATLNAASAISVDASGRIVVTLDGVDKTIDSPLENLALYITLMEKGYLPGLDLQDGVSLGALSFLSDPAFTAADMMMAASLLSAASDKFGAISLDTVVYLNAVLGVDGMSPVTGPDGKTYVDYSDVVYDRSDTYTGEVSFLVNNGDSTYTLVTKSIMEAVFSGADYTGEDAAGFAQAAEDARAVLLFVHNNAPPGE